jgi:hypothetical protein
MRRIPLILLWGGVFLWACHDPSNLNVFGKAVDIEAMRVVDASGSILWEIARPRDEERARVRTIRYGEVPLGFSQTAPQSRTPRPLREGESVAVLITTGDTLACSRGIALGPSRYRQSMYETIPRNGTTAAWRSAVREFAACRP